MVTNYVFIAIFFARIYDYVIIFRVSKGGEEGNQPYHIHNINQVNVASNIITMQHLLCEHTIMSLPTTNVNITRVYNQSAPP